MKRVLFAFSLICLCLCSTGQYLIPSGAEAQLISTSEKLQSARMFTTEQCHVLLLKDNVICRLDGNVDESIKLLRINDTKHVKDIIAVGSIFIVQQDDKLMSIASKDGRISTTQNIEMLLKDKQSEMLVFPSLSDDLFFVVSHKWKHKQKRSIVQCYDIKRKTIKTMFEIDGWVNCMSGDTSVICFGIDKSLLLMKNQTILLLSSEDSDITSVCLSPFGLFYSTYQSVQYMIDSEHKVTIIEKGASQLVDCCNTLYMILVDGSLIRIHNTLAFAEFYGLLKQSNNENTHPDH